MGWRLSDPKSLLCGRRKFRVAVLLSDTSTAPASLPFLRCGKEMPHTIVFVYRSASSLFPFNNFWSGILCVLTLWVILVLMFTIRLSLPMLPIYLKENQSSVICEWMTNCVLFSPICENKDKWHPTSENCQISWANCTVQLFCTTSHGHSCLKRCPVSTFKQNVFFCLSCQHPSHWASPCLSLSQRQIIPCCWPTSARIRWFSFWYTPAEKNCCAKRIRKHTPGDGCQWQQDNWLSVAWINQWFLWNERTGASSLIQ